MSKPVKELLRKNLIGRLEGVDSLAVVGFTGVDAVTTNAIRKRLVAKNIKMTVIKNSIARQAFKSVGLDDAIAMIEGPCAIAYGAEGVVTVVRELLEMGKDSPNLTVKAAYMDGEIFGAERIEELSRYPTWQEAIALLISAALGPAKKLAGCLVGPGRKLAGIVKAVEDKAEKAAPREAA